MSDDRGSIVANYHSFTVSLNYLFLYYLWYYYSEHWSFSKIVFSCISKTSYDS